MLRCVAGRKPSKLVRSELYALHARSCSSEIFWEAIELFVSSLGHLLEICAELIAKRAELYINAI